MVWRIRLPGCEIATSYTRHLGNEERPKAEQPTTYECGIGDGTELNLRGVFDLSDVETLRLLAHAKKSLGGVFETRVKANGKVCRIHCAIRLDNNGEPFCIIGTVLFPLKIQSDAKEIEQ